MTASIEADRIPICRGDELNLPRSILWVPNDPPRVVLRGRSEVPMSRLRAGAMILAASLLSVGSNGAVAAQSPTSPPQGPAASPGPSVPIIGPDLLGPAPSPPFGPEWVSASG